MKVKLAVMLGLFALGPLTPAVAADGEVRLSGHLTLKDGKYYCFGQKATILDNSSDDVVGEWVYGTGADDVIVLARNGTNFVRAGGGNDLICGGSGSDLVTDESRGYDGRVWVGDPPGDDKMDLAGNWDSVTLSGGSNVVHLGDGDDQIVRIWTSIFEDPAASDSGDVDKIYGARGNDWFDFRDVPNLRVVIDGGPGKDDMRGSPGDDVLKGGDGKDHIVGKEGKDRCVGGSGDDHYYQCEIRG